MESAVSQALKKIEIFVEGFLSSPNRDSYRLVEYLVADEGKLKWLGSLEGLKLFIESSLCIDGRWSSPGGNAKKLRLNQSNLQPRSQGFSLFVIGKAGKGPGTGRSSMYSDWSMTSTLLCK